VRSSRVQEKQDGLPEEVAKLRGEVEEARRRAESAEMAAHTIQRAHTEAVEKATRAESAQERALRHLHEEHAARVHEVRARYFRGIEKGCEGVLDV
jgi:predicted transcriptional regulator